MRPTTTLFIPTLNEEDAMRVILPQIDRSWVDQILVVDASTDGTAAYAREEEQDDEANRDALPKEAQHLFSSNPDRRNSITTRSFSAAPRTGRPKKMPFRQGDPDDLDAIDE